MKLSANLGFLWTELALPDAIAAAAGAGFAAVECHWPYEAEASLVAAALAETGTQMISLNTPRGDPARGEAGLAAVPGRQVAARAAIDRAVDYAAAVGCSNVHVMAGVADGPRARAAFVGNLSYAAERAGAAGIAVLVEPLNRRDNPGCFLTEVEQAAAIVEAVNEATGTTGARIMFDCYHVQISQGDLLRRFESHLPLIGHVQFAGVPHRQEPDRGEVDYRWLLGQLDGLGYTGYVGAEYRPAAGTEAGLGWLDHYR